MKTKQSIRLVILLTIGIFPVFFLSCKKEQPGQAEKKSESAQTVTSVADPLPSWNETASKKAIIDFVTSVTTEGSPKFVPVEQRIATFDNDGTLWCEQPLYFEFVYSMDEMKEIFKAKPELLKKPELKALSEGNKEAFLKSGEKGIGEVFVISHTIGTDEFNKSVQNWLTTAKHEKFGKPYGELTYKPMVELLEYLRNNQFKTFIVSGGSSMFMRNFTEKAYGIPAEQVIGTMLKAQFQPKGDSFEITYLPEIWHNDDQAGKPVAIAQLIGKKPIFAFGNSDGDLEMLQWTSTNSLPNLSLIVHHTDSVREFAYDRQSHVGKLDKALDEGNKRGWIITDMEKDWKVVFNK